MGKRNAQARLVKHETLPKVYSEALIKTPDKDIWLLLIKFEPISIVSFDGNQNEYATTIDDENKHIKRYLTKDITFQQKINFTEASLIKYFQPEYNIQFKAKFPNPSHLTYSECYNLDLNSISVELETTELGHKLWSPTIPPEWLHILTYNLHDRNIRKSMFDFWSK